MAITNLVRIVLAGALPGGERWSCSFALMGTGVNSQDDLDGIVSDVADRLADTDYSTVFHTIANTNTNTDSVTGYFYPALPGDAEFVSELPVDPIPGTQSAQHPNQCALVVTLNTGAAGRRARGRIYLPATGVSLTNSELSSANTTAIANGIADFFNGVNGPSGGTVVSVASVTGGATRPVTQVKVDSRLDIQRRRANKQTIAFVANATVTTV